MKNLYYILLISLLFNSCKKHDVYNLNRPSSWYFNNDQIDFVTKTLYVKEKENGKFRYQIIFSDRNIMHLDYGEFLPEGTVLTMCFIGDTLTELDANQQLIFDSTCYIAWGVNNDSNSFERKEYIKSGYLSITQRNLCTGFPYQISFTGKTEEGNTIDLTSYVMIIFNQELFQTVSGQFTFKDSLYMLSYGSYSGMNSSNFHRLDFYYTDYENHTSTQLNVYVNNNGSSELAGDYYGHYQDPLHFFTVFTFVYRDRNNNVTWRYFYEGQINIVKTGSNYNVLFVLTDQGDTISGCWAGPLD